MLKTSLPLLKIVSGGGTISGTTYTPDDISTNTDVTIRYTIAADGSCAESTADVTFTVADECEEYLTLFALDDNNPGNLYYINIGDNSPVVSTVIIKSLFSTVARIHGSFAELFLTI